MQPVDRQPLADGVADHLYRSYFIDNANSPTNAWTA